MDKHIAIYSRKGKFYEKLYLHTTKLIISQTLCWTKKKQAQRMELWESFSVNFKRTSVCGSAKFQTTRHQRHMVQTVL